MAGATMLSVLPDQWSWWLQSRVTEMTSPWVLCVLLAAVTLLVEDVAIAAGVSLAAGSKLSWFTAGAAVGVGIVAGDLLLYAFGRAARVLPKLQMRIQGRSGGDIERQLNQKLAAAVLLARVIPGFRFLCYTVSGFLSVPFGAFLSWVVVAVTLWVGATFGLSAVIGPRISMWLNIPVPVAAALPIVAFAFILLFLRRYFPATSAKFST